MSNQANIVRLLRAVANGTDAKASSRDIVFNAAADEIERLQRIIDSRPSTPDCLKPISSGRKKSM